jgi:naphthoate synthase
VNKVVPAASLREEVRQWANEMLALSPTALRFLKQSFNADTEHIGGLGQIAFTGLGLFVDSDEAHEGVTAFNEKRPPDFSAYRAAVSR